MQNKDENREVLTEIDDETAFNSGDLEAHEGENGEDVTQSRLQDYDCTDDAETEAIVREWKVQEKARKRRLNPVSALLMLGVTCFIPWYIGSYHEDIAYFFSSAEPIDLGDASTYRIAGEGETERVQAFEDNRYVAVRGIPIRHVGIQVKENPIEGRVDKLIYALMGSSIYVQENLEGSKFAQFMSGTSTTLGAGAVEALEIRGRLRRFDVDDAGKYQPVRDFYAKKYGTIFCGEMSDSEKKRKAAMLGQGGLALQIMPDGAVVQGETQTHATLHDVEPLRGRSGMAIGSDNAILHTIDGGLTWRKAQLPIPVQATSLAYADPTGQIVFGGKKGWVGGESYTPSEHALSISQDVLDIAFTHPEEGDTTRPRMIAVGREGLLETASLQREGWMPSRIEEETSFRDVLRVGKTWYAAGDRLMIRRGESWVASVLPQKVQWNGLCEIPGYVVAVGDHGAVARHAIDDPSSEWEIWPSDDVPGIEFRADLRACATDGKGKTWVGVGTKGSIVIAQADESGNFGTVQRISGAYASYGVVRDIVAGVGVENALREALHRYTPEDFYDVTWHDGTFYAVGSESLFMTSSDGASWNARKLALKHKRLHAIAFTGDKTGVLAGEKGVMWTTEDNGETWQSKKSQTERSIYDLAVSEDYPGGFVYVGAYGLWGFCEAVNGRCYQRSRTESYHYNAAALTDDAQQSGRLQFIVAGDDARLDHIQDVIGADALRTSSWTLGNSKVYDMAFADRELPLLPNAARGTVGLIAAGDGSLYRSMDGGYTFHREESGFEHPVKRVTMTPDGDTAWIFDGNGNAAEDVHGLSLWKSMKLGRLDGVLTAKGGYLIDENCVYYRDKQRDQKIACTDGSFTLHDIAIDGDNIVLGVLRDGVYGISELVRTSKPSGDDVPNAEIRVLDVIAGQNVSKHAQSVACGATRAIFDPDAQQWITQDGITPNVQDVQCLQNRVALLTAKNSQNGVWTLAATVDNAPLWSMEVGFDPHGAQFYQTRDNRTWVATESPLGAFPLILKRSSDNQWSWRRDRITDFHAVDTAGPWAVAVGDNGTILVSNNDGESWHAIATKLDQTLRDVCLAEDGSFGIAVGDRGAILRADKDLNHWSRVKYKLEFDVTSCTIAEQKDRFQVYFAGKGGAIYTSDRDMSRLDLIASPSFEDIYSLTTLETGEVLAVGGVYQDPTHICEDGFIIEADKAPRSYALTMLLTLILCAIWAFAVRRLVLGWRHRNDP